MNQPRQNRAGQYMQQVLANISDDPPPEKMLEILVQCSEFADADLTECQANEQKQAVWAALLSAVRLVILSNNGDASACRALCDALINRSLGRPGDDSLTSAKISNTRPVDEEWIRACTIALVDAHPDLRQQTYKDAARILDVQEASLTKMRENFRGSRIGAQVLVDLVATARNQIAEFNYNRLKDLI
jgi:hypothetical protein